jgi:hypothetical protein
MASSKKAPKEEKKDSPDQSKRNVGVVVLVVIIVLAVAGALAYGLNAPQQSQTSIDVFESNFDSAQNVSIIVTAYNGPTLAASSGCASSLIEQVTATHGSAHKNASMIGFYVINSTKCLYTQHLRITGAKYSNSTPEFCVNLTKGTPSIFINYSNANRTIIMPDALYVSGTMEFLSQCGVASEITAT